MFPSGSLPSNRTRPVVIAWLAMSIACAVLIAVEPVVNITPSGSASVSTSRTRTRSCRDPGLVRDPGAGLRCSRSCSSLLRRAFCPVRPVPWSSGLERLQYRWLMWSIGVVTLALSWAIATVVLRGDEARVFIIPLVIAYPCVPIAVVIAVLRYRLYEIDRLVSRTLGWAWRHRGPGPVRHRRARVQRPSAASSRAELAVAAPRCSPSSCSSPCGRVCSVRRPAVRPPAARGGAEPRRVRRAAPARGDLGAVSRDVEATAVAALRRSTIALWIRPSRATRP